MRATFFNQLKALLWRNLLLKRRNTGQLAQEIFYPLMYVGILIAIKTAVKPATKPALTFPVNQLSDFSLAANSSLYVVTNGLNTATIDSVMSKVTTQLTNVDTRLFSSESEMTMAYNANTSIVSACIIFGYNNNSVMQHYAIRIPHEAVPDSKVTYTGKGSQDQGECREIDTNGTWTNRCQVNKYLSSGFAYLQKLINQALMQELDSTLPSVSVGVQLMPKPEYTTDLSYLQTISSIYFVLAYSFFINFLTTNLVAEKEKKIRDGMFMMGLRSSVFWLSWSIVYFVIILIVTSVVTLIASLGSFFSHSNMFIMWLLLMLYGLSIIALSYLITPFFKKARTAGAVASFSTIIISLLYLAVSESRTQTATGYDYGVPPAAQWALCLASPVALALAMDKGIWLDNHGGMNFDTMGEGAFPLYAPVVMLIVDIILYFLLAIYFDHVIPGEYGPRYKPLYFLQKSYWLPNSGGSGERTHLFSSQDMTEGETGVSGPRIEPVSADMNDKRTMRIVNISKVFEAKKETVTAVNGLSLDMYEGQITALLGHNGAGKTTLINMLTGIIPPSSGTATIRGLDVSSSGDMEELRSLCGICPQHNILYDELSAKEHLHIFAGIKGVPSDKVEADVSRALQSVDLEDQADVLASKLSGGQKRKLSVAMALIGDPKIIFLDEPTAGMDPYSRRHLWALLKKSKEGRLILLTTHFMDEADILADRKAIVSKGKLQCCGSSLFLKTKFGIGYHLNMVVEPTCDRDAVTSLLNQHVGGAEFDRSHGKELSFTIPISEVGNFANLFKALEKSEGSQTTAQSIGILNYGVSMPTLEEVFLKLGNEEEVNDAEDDSTPGLINTNYQGSLSHINANFEGDSRSEVNIAMRSNTADPGQVLQSLQSEKAKPGVVFAALVKMRFLLAVRSPATWIFGLIFPVGLVTGGLVLGRTSSTKSNTPTALSLAGDLYARGLTAQANLPPFVLQDSVGDAVSVDILAQLQTLFHVDNYTALNLSTVAPHFIGADLRTTTASSVASYTALYNDSAIHSLPAALSAMTAAILKEAGQAQDIVTYNYPWPKKAELTYDNGAFSSALMIGMAFALMAPGFAVAIVQERQWKCKSQLRIAGVSFHMFWGSVFAFSIIVYLIPASACLIIALAMQVPSLTPAGAIVSLILLFLLFIPTALLLALVFTYLFSKFETAQSVLPSLFIMGGMMPYLAVSLLDMLAKESIAQVLHCILCFIDPIYIIFGGFYYIDKIYRYAQLFQQESSVGDYFEFKNNIIVCHIACVVDFCLLYLLLRVLEVRSDGGTVREALRFSNVNTVRDIPHTNQDTVQEEDQDVAHERARVERLEQGGDGGTEAPVAYVRQIRKEFVKTGKSEKPCVKPAPDKVKVAVRNLSFAVNKGEVFGLLGPNGAGKTTALSMMTAEVHPSRGKVVLAGNHVRSNISDAFQALGFCPQHDPLWETLKLREHIELYAIVKGVPKHEVPVVVKYFLDNLKLHEHANKNAKKLSGGTKRKLCYAMSMLGWPEVVLLDEPSTGMDPQSKRFLWDTISSSFEGQERGAILTTHYMEEADALCTRVGIMVNGQLECLGPTQHLKQKYGSGYLLEVKLGGSSTASRDQLEDRMKSLEQHLITLFPNASCLESFAERAQYKIPQSDVAALSVTFSALEDTKQSHGMEEYSFSQSTLEQVFLNFAKKQLEADEDADDAEAKGSPERQLSSSPAPLAHPVEDTNDVDGRLSARSTKLVPEAWS